MSEVVSLILAGGVGSRFWPKSRANVPKQFLRLVGEKSMIQNTADRLRRFTPDERIFVVTTQSQIQLLQSQLPWLVPENVIVEPFGKNTAPCIALASLYIRRKYPQATCVVCPADHIVSDIDSFGRVIATGIAVVDDNPFALVTIGIEPNYPATGYGYIQKGDSVADYQDPVYHVRTFAEKPHLEVAQKFLATGEFFWNSGIFLWKVSSILHYIEQFLPDLYDGMMKIDEEIDTLNEKGVTEVVYKQIYSQSIDYGVMEKASHVFMVKGDFGWNDLGSWAEVYKISPHDHSGNVIKGNVIAKGMRNSLIEGEKRIIAIIGVEDLVVVDTPDALLICKKDQSQEVKWIVEKLKSQKKNVL